MGDPTDVLEGIVYEPTQRESIGFDLTVANVERITAPGRVDFGGGELESAETTSVSTHKRNEEDDYEWWELEAGQYVLEYNESLNDDDATVTIQPREALLERGAFHPTVRLTALTAVPLSVGGAGFRLKENARVSTILEVKRS